MIILILRSLSSLPMRVLYLKSNVLAWVLGNILSYRRKVIVQNLRKSFPEKSEPDIRWIAGRYYQHLADLIVETVKLNSIGKEELLRRCRFLNPEVLKAYEHHGKNAIIMMGHSGNWEWAGAATELYFNFRLLPVYRRVKNKGFNDFFFRLRSRFGSQPVLDQEAAAVIAASPAPHAVAMLADQTPGSRKGWWTTFLHQPTPFFRGSEILSRRLGYDVVFAHVRTTSKRGHYEIWLEKADPMLLNQSHGLTRAFAVFLEKEIKREPYNWLWSHRRWKHKPTENSEWMD